MIKKVGILYHPLKEAARMLAEELARELKSLGAAVWQCSAWEEDRARLQVNGTDLILTTGGDGTILHAAQVADSIPITGINLGRVGFMTELGVDEATPALRRLLEGKGWLDERAMLEADVTFGGESKRFYALNDVVAGRGSLARLVTIEAAVDGEPLTSYRADGVIVATPTGSTGYSLAAGGPVLHPRSEEFILRPIAPHLSASYSVVLPPKAAVSLKVLTKHEATLSIDGILNQPLADGAIIAVRRSSRTTRFLRLRPRAFYTSLDEKLAGRR